MEDDVGRDALRLCDARAFGAEVGEEALGFIAHGGGFLAAGVLLRLLRRFLAEVHGLFAAQDGA